MPKASGIYRISCVASERVYVGSAVNLAKRWNEHRRHLRKGTHHNAALQAAWLVYGEKAFSFHVLEEVPRDHLIARENHWMQELETSDRKRGYNMSPAGGSQLGFKHSTETRRRMSETRQGQPFKVDHLQAHVDAMRGKPLDDQVKQKLSQMAKERVADPERGAAYRQAQANKTITPDGRRRMSEANVGRTWSKEQREKSMATRVGRKHSPEAIQRMREAAALRKKDINGKFA